jgi:hypothetical protein
LLLPGGALEKFMALGRDVVDAIIREHSNRPIGGDVLLVGQQTVNITEANCWSCCANTELTTHLVGGPSQICHSLAIRALK